MLSDEAIKKRDELAEAWVMAPLSENTREMLLKWKPDNIAVHRGLLFTCYQDAFESGVEFERARTQKLAEALEDIPGLLQALRVDESVRDEVSRFVHKALEAHKAGE